MFYRELKVNLKALIIWSIVLGGLNILTLSLYPEIANQQQSLSEMLKTYPPALIKAFDLDKLGFGNILEYYATKGYSFVALFGSIYAVMIASSILSKEENEKTIEFLLSKPVSRSEIINHKLFAMFVSILMLNVILAAANFIGSRIAAADNFSILKFLLLSLALLLLHITFSCIAFFISTIIRKTRNVLSISLALVLITYILQILSKTSSSLQSLKYISPFEYANAVDIITIGQIKTVYMLIMFIIIIVSLIFSYLIYRKKDIFV